VSYGRLLERETMTGTGPVGDRRRRELALGTQVEKPRGVDLNPQGISTGDVQAALIDCSARWSDVRGQEELSQAEKQAVAESDPWGTS
jgi:hypothetical protein